MKKFISAILLLILFSSCAHTVYKSLNWQSTKVTADGWNIEWPDELRFIDEKTKISYDITNDLHNLYVCMRVADPTVMMKIIHGGMEFRIDTLGKKSFPIAFIFPTANEIVLTQDKRGASQKEDNYGERQNHSPMKQKILSPATEALLVGFKHQQNGTISLLHNTSGISAAIEIDSLGILSYEAIIPFSTFYKDELTRADTNNVFNYEIRINALSAPQAHEGGGGQRMSGGMGGGGHHGGGQHGSAGGEESHGGEHRGEGGNYTANSDLYVSSQFTQKMKFSLK